MRARLTGKNGQFAGKSFVVGDDAVIGSNAVCDVHLRHGVITDRHARLTAEPRKDCYILEDLRSANGTKVDGRDIRGKVRLGPRHILTFANVFSFTFEQVGEEEPEDRAAPASEPEIPSVAAPARVEDHMARTIVLDAAEMFKDMPKPAEPLHIEFRTVKAGKQSVLLKQGDNTIGRSPNNDIVIDNPSISRQHAVLTLEGEKITLKDLDSRNGTFVRDERIEGAMQVEPEMELRFGLVKAMVMKKGGAGHR